MPECTLTSGISGQHLAECWCGGNANLQEKICRATGNSRHGLSVVGGRCKRGQMQDRIILLVEDDAIVRSVASEALQEMGWQVEEAGSSSDAEAKFRAHAGNIKAAIIDIGLPDRKGDELARELRQMNDRLPIALVSGYGSESLEETFKGDPLVAYLGKPYDLDQLEALLEKFDLKNS